MRLGILLPSFAASADAAISTAELAEANGVHGVFAYDHLWPMGQPGRPAISPYPMLGAVSELTEAISLGTLVARVGLVPDDVLVSELLTLNIASKGRMIAGVGAGDSKSSAENEAFGVEFAPARERRTRLRTIVIKLTELGIPVWVGGGSDKTNVIAWETGAVLNLWSAPATEVTRCARKGPVTWGGTLPNDQHHASEHLASLAAAGALWAVVACPGAIDPILDAAVRAGIILRP